MKEFPAANEWHLLIYCCRLAIEKKVPSLPINIVLIEVDWDMLLELATLHKIRPLLFKGISKWDYFPQIPPTFIEKLKAICFQITIKNLNHTNELIQLLQLFQKAGISNVLPYKGVLLAEVAYNDINAREYTDLDLLIAFKDLLSIKNLLMERGYQPELEIPSHLLPKFMKQYYEFNFGLFKAGKRIFHIEPHWLIGPKIFQLQFSYTDFRPFIIQKEILNNTMNTLNPEGLLLSTCLHHGGQDKWQNLKQVSDIAAILTQFGQDINWHQVLAIAKKWKVENLILLGCGLTASFFSIQLPELITQNIENKKIDRFIQISIKNLREKTVTQPFSKDAILQSITYHLSLRANWLTKIKIVYFHFLKFVLPNENDINFDNQHSSYFLLLLKKPIRLWQQYFSHISGN